MDCRAFAIEIVRIQLQNELMAAEAASQAALRNFGVLDRRHYRAVVEEFRATRRLRVANEM